jgi:hypothetical protein
MRIQSNQRGAKTPTASTTASAPTQAEGTGAVENPGWSARTGRTQPARAPNGTAIEERNRAAAEGFFKALGSRDLSTLEHAYQPGAAFRDDMFDLTRRSSILKMWAGAPPFTSFSAEVIEARGDQVRARWTCEYVMFGRPVRNEIESTLTFAPDGTIASQHEHWDRTKWMTQALPVIPRFLQGPAYAVMGRLLSWKLGG